MLNLSSIETSTARSQASIQKNSVVIGRGGFLELELWFQKTFGLNPSRLHVFVDKNVLDSHPYIPEILRKLDNCEVVLHQLALSNATKNVESLLNVLKIMKDDHLDGNSLILAIGGSVILDLVGFAASIYHRGRPWCAIPTTLLSQTDGAIGGTVGIHFHGLTNYIGARYIPELTLVDTAFLDTLPEKELSSGFAEVIKHGVVTDSSIVEMFVTCGLKITNSELDKLLVRVIDQKIKLLCNGNDGLLNIGHTFGQALESYIGHDNINHGEAVSLGLVFVCRLAERLNLLERDTRRLIEASLEAVNLPIDLGSFKPAHCIMSEPKESFQKLIDLICRDKKSRGGNPQWILPICLQRITVQEVKPELIHMTLKDVLNLEAGQ